MRSLVLLTGTLLLSGCVVETPGPTQHDLKTIDLSKAETLRASFRMKAGTLRVDSTSQKTARADFTYNVRSWKPYVHYSDTGGRADLTVEQPGNSHTHVGHTRYEWDMRLNRDVPLDLRVNFGAGEAELNLAQLTLRSVDVEMGVGKLDLDLRGEPKQSYDVRIRGGVGEATVHLPRDIGVSAQAEGGIGEIQVNGLRKEGHRYFNEAWEQSKVRIHLDVRGGIGSIRLIAE